MHLPTTAIEPILFLSCSLITAKKNYWLTKLKVSGIVWVICKTCYLINLAPANMLPVIYTDHASTIAIAAQKLLKTSFMDKLNLCLVCALQYIQQFWLLIYYKPGKTNIITNSLLYLLIIDNLLTLAD